MVKRRQANKRAMKVVVKPRKKETEKMTLLGQALRSLGGLGGGALGTMFGAPGVGGAVGTSLGGAISKWLGSGDYNVSSNTIVKQSLKAAASIPSMHNDGQTVVIRHKEYLGEIKGSTVYTVQRSYELNPANPTTFPWLSSIAESFQEYKFRGVVFHYVPSSGSAISGTSPALGTVMLQTSYRSSDTPPASKVEMLNEYCSNEVVPSEPMAHPIECDPKENPFNIMYVRNGPPPAGDSKLMYDLGITHVATSGQLASGNVIGDLWITYEVELKKPIVYSNVTSRDVSAQFNYSGVTDVANLFDLGKIVNVLGTNFVTPQPNNTILINPGRGAGRRVLFVLRYSGASNWTASTTSGVLTSLVNCVAAPWAGAPAPTMSGTNGTYTSLGSAFTVFAVDVIDTTQNASFRVPNPALTGNLSWDIQFSAATLDTTQRFP